MAQDKRIEMWVLNVEERSESFKDERERWRAEMDGHI